ncbi:MAG: S-methyl-5-thioribose-1-phosphate isomerase [Bacteroidota bacterium]|nr:S-methyl-5-thioribose-1-phosphate isomerase [Bacteroidota bacterium]
MLINNKPYHTIWTKQDNNEIVQIIDQRKLPFEVSIVDLISIDDVFYAIKDMLVRGAPLIGVAASYGMYLGVLKEKSELSDSKIIEFAKFLKSARPTAVNLEYAVDLVVKNIIKLKTKEAKIDVAFKLAKQLKEKEILASKRIGENGVKIIEELFIKKNKKTINILTHCNAGWLACIDYGTATAPIYKAKEIGIDIHVWVDETRPRNQGARLTAWELEQNNIPYTIISDNTGGLLMQKDMVDVVVVGSDRTTISGDVANKIGTYLKALAAYDNNVPFYVALPTSTIDKNISDGKEIPIEERNSDEVKYIEGLYKNKITKVLITPPKSRALNFGFDVTPAKYVTALITDKGICKANKSDITKTLAKDD